MIEFPCDFPIKMMATNRPGVAEELVAIVRQHHPELENTHIQYKLSQSGTYVSVTVNIVAQNQLALDALYIALNQHPDIKMVL